MRNYLERLDKKQRQVLTFVGRLADKVPVNAYVVGGPVRDILLKRKVIDLDIVVEGDAIALAKQYARHSRGTVVVHERFGTASVRCSDGRRVDFATARQEEYEHPGALPRVKVGFIGDDLFRRDFTVNAMAIRINSGRFGQLVDEFGGLKDIQGKKIRILHDRSFVDDPTRILRAVRFEQRLGFALEKKTLGFLTLAIKDDSPSTVKPERYFTEFRKALSEPSPVKVLSRLNRLQGLKFLGLSGKIDSRLMRTLEYNIRLFSVRHKTVDRSQLSFLYVMALLQDRGSGQRTAFGEKFNLTRRERTAVLQLASVKGIFRFLNRKRLASSAVFKALRPLSIETVAYMWSFRSVAVVQQRIDVFLDRSSHVSLGINGHDLEGFGVASGRQMKDILDDILSAKIDGKIRTRKQELAWARKSAKGIRERK